ncbi:MAG: PhnB protein [Verrucomicrobiota bacterium]|nr:PhnB protein [Verrucomicrobiota bacterium]
MDIQVTLSFLGRTEEALAFYGRAIAAVTVFLQRFRDCPDPAQRRPGFEDKIFHATFRVGATEIMASDCGCENQSTTGHFGGFALALRTDTPQQAERFFAALSAGGQVELPLMKTFFATRYGIVTDRFGVSWKIMTEPDSCSCDG